MSLIDTHCHIHEADYPLDPSDTMRRAYEAEVTAMICVGTSEQSSNDAIKFAQSHDGIYASIGVHPHDTKDGYARIKTLFGEAKLVAVGEIGLDYFYNHSPRELQIEALEAQLQLAIQYGLPVIFHVREAFEDFWPIFDNFSGLRGELHSFTDTTVNLEAALQRNLLIGVNGISTFTKDNAQKAMFARIPESHLLLETDAPYLTPVPFRGKVNEPAFVRNVAEHHATLCGVSLDHLARVTSANASRLFAL